MVGNVSKPTLLKEFSQKNKNKNPPQETPVGTTGLLLVYIYIDKIRKSVCKCVSVCVCVCNNVLRKPL